MRLLKYSIVFTVGEPLLLLKESRPRLLLLLSFHLCTPHSPKSAVLKLWLLELMKEKARIVHQLTPPARQRGTKYVE